MFKVSCRDVRRSGGHCRHP